MAELATGELRVQFLQWAGAPIGELEPDQPPYPAQVRRAWENATRGATLLAEAAAAGSGYALGELKHFAHEMNERAGHAARLHPEPAPPASTQPSRARQQAEASVRQRPKLKK